MSTSNKFYKVNILHEQSKTTTKEVNVKIQKSLKRKGEIRMSGVNARNNKVRFNEDTKGVGAGRGVERERERDQVTPR